MADPVVRGFGAPPEVRSYFDGKTSQPRFSWLDVWAEEHSHAFTVAKATDLELLTTFRGSISRAIETGQGFEAWKAEVRGELARIGWLGPRMVSDPDGIDPDRLVDFSSSRRLRTIFWSNVNSARAAGQWERAQRTKRALPYLLYVRTTSSDPRQEHLAWVGIILAVDDPFWRSHFPPNGWGCKCQVRQISAREAEQLLGRPPVEGGILYKREAPDLGPDIPFVNRRTGETTMIPPGIDPGWQTNPGLSRSSTLIRNLEDRLQASAAQDALPVLEELWRDPFLKVAPRLEPKVWLPAGHSVRLVEALPGAVSPIVSIPGEAITLRTVKHGLDLDDFALLPRMLQEGLILPDEGGNAATRTILARFGKKFFRAFISLSSSGYLRVNSFHPRRLRDVARRLEAIGRSIDEVPDLGE